MLDALLTTDRPAAGTPDLLASLERASGAIARLDQALDNHPLPPAFPYRARLEAVRRQAAVDGQSIDPWHLAAVLEGLRLRIIDRCQIFEAARTALALHQWITEPDFDQEGEVQAAERHLAAASGLVGAGEAFRSWLQQGGTRPPIRAALVRLAPNLPACALERAADGIGGELVGEAQLVHAATFVVEARHRPIKLRHVIDPGSREMVRDWGLRFGWLFANTLKRHRPRNYPPSLRGAW